MIPSKQNDPKWGARMILAPVLLPSHIFGIVIPSRKKLRLFSFVHRLLIFGSLILVFLHELPSVKYWHEHSEAYHSSKINAIIDSLNNSTFALPMSVQNKIFKFNFAHIVINVVTVIGYNILGHDLTWPNSNYTPYTSTLYIFSELVTFMCCYEFIQMVNLINEIFKQINAKLKVLKRKIKSGESPNGEAVLEGREVVNLRELHLFLSRTCAEVNCCFSIQILLIIFFSMIQIIYALRSVVGDFAITDIEESMLNIIADLFWLLPFVLMLLQLIAFSERTSTEGRRTIIVVHSLMNLYYYDRKYLKELEVFAMQIKQNPIIFSVKFFDLDYPFLNTMVSSLATYFIIIVTFQGETDSGVPINWEFKPPTTTEMTTTTTS